MASSRVNLLRFPEGRNGPFDVLCPVPFDPFAKHVSLMLNTTHLALKGGQAGIVVGPVNRTVLYAWDFWHGGDLGASTSP